MKEHISHTKLEANMRVSSSQHGEGVISLVDERSNELSVDFNNGICWKRVSLSHYSRSLYLIEETNNEATQKKILVSDVLASRSEENVSWLTAALRAENNKSSARLANQQPIEVDAEKAREERAKKSFESAVAFLDFFEIDYPTESELNGPTAKFKRFLFGGYYRGCYRTEIISIAEQEAYQLETEQLEEYIANNGLEGVRHDPIYKTYLLKSPKKRVTHCFKCRAHLESSASNACAACGWIKCDCGACGCTYSGSVSGS